MKQGHILVVDDNKNVLDALRILLNRYFEQVTLITTPNVLISKIRESSPDVVLLDMNYSAGINTGNEGLYWLSEIKKIAPDMPVVLFTAYADIELAVESLKRGATDFIVKPWDNAKLLATLKSALALGKSKGEVKKLKETQEVLRREINRDSEICWGESRAIKELLDIIKKVAGTNANILLTGENGTGKEVVAREIHRCSSRGNQSLITVDMGAVTESLFESELFGHVKGAFTDAKNDRAGKFEAADKGTLFLDEIGNLNMVLQAKLLNAIQSRQIVRVGSNKPIEVDIRLITATNRDLHSMVKSEEFREDLLYRINTIEIKVPALRERVDDIPMLAEFFLKQYSKKYNKPELQLSKSAIDKLTSYAWPGNVRELKHAIEKATILSDGTTLTSDDFLLVHKESEGWDGNVKTLGNMEMSFIKKALQRHDNNISMVAQELGITRPTLYNKIKKYNL